MSPPPLPVDNWCPVVFSGPSGAGKSTLITRLMEEFKNQFAFGVSHTTRQPRPGEVKGVHYHYITREDFIASLGKGDFIEHTQFSGNYYGTSKQAIEDVRKSGRICLLDIDACGVVSVKELGFKAFFIFIQPPTLKDLEDRLKNRGTETEESLKKRLDTADAAMKLAATPGIYDVVITNDDLDKAYGELRKALMTRFSLVR